MESRKFILQQTAILSAGHLICLAIMLGIFSLLGYWGWDVAVGGAIGTILAVLNFFFTAIGADMAADKAEVHQDAKGGRGMIRTSYSLRLVILAVLLFAFGKILQAYGENGICNLFALVLPLVFTTPILMVTQFFQKDR